MTDNKLMESEVETLMSDSGPKSGEKPPEGVLDLVKNEIKDPPIAEINHNEEISRNNDDSEIAKKLLDQAEEIAELRQKLSLLESKHDVVMSSNKCA